LDSVWILQEAQLRQTEEAYPSLARDSSGVDLHFY